MKSPFLTVVLLFIAVGCDQILTEGRNSATTGKPSLIDISVYKPQTIQLAAPGQLVNDQASEHALMLEARPDEFGTMVRRRNEQRIMELISRIQSPGMDYPGEVSLAEVFSFIESWLTDEAGFVVSIQIDPTDPDIGSSSGSFLKETTIADLRIPENSMTLHSALRTILSEVQDQELTWIVRDESLLITTVATLESEENLLLRSYDLTELKPLRLSNQAICLSVRELTSPPTLWIDNGDDIGTMLIVGNHLLVRQTRTGQESVIEVLERMKLAAR